MTEPREGFREGLPPDAVLIVIPLHSVRVFERYDAEGKLACDAVAEHGDDCECRSGANRRLQPVDFQPGDVVICRAKAPLVKMADMQLPWATFPDNGAPCVVDEGRKVWGWFGLVQGTLDFHEFKTAQLSE